MSRSWSRRGYVTLGLVVSLLGLIAAGALMVSQAKLFTMDGRDQEGADAAGIAAARVLSTRSNAFAAMNQLAAELVAELAMGRGSCAGAATAASLVAAGAVSGRLPNMDTVARITEVCGSVPAIEAGHRQALTELSTREKALAATADADALTAARSAAAQSGDWDEVGLSPPVGRLDVEAANAGKFCLAVSEELETALADSIPVRRATSSPEDAAIALAFTSAARAAAATECVVWAARLLAPRDDEMDLLAWTERRSGLTLFDGTVLPETTFRGVAATRARRVGSWTVGGLVTDQTWKVAMVPIGHADARTRIGAPAMSWDDLVH